MSVPENEIAQWKQAYHFAIDNNLDHVSLAALWKLWNIGDRSDLVVINLMRITSDNKDERFCEVSTGAESEIAIDCRNDLIRNMVGIEISDEEAEKIWLWNGFENQAKNHGRFKKIYPKAMTFLEMVSSYFIEQNYEGRYSIGKEIMSNCYRIRVSSAISSFTMKIFSTRIEISCKPKRSRKERYSYYGGIEAKVSTRDGIQATQRTGYRETRPCDPFDECPELPVRVLREAMRLYPKKL